MPSIKFKKRFMKRSELIRMGIPKEMLDTAYRDPDQKFASKADPTKPNSTIVFDTDGFVQWWERNIRVQQAMIGG